MNRGGHRGPIVVRQASLRDLPRLCRLYQESHLFHQRRLPRVFRRLSGPSALRPFLKGLLKGRRSAVFVAESDGTVLGAIHAILTGTRRIPVLVPRTLVAVDSLIVSKSARHKGMGTALCRAVEAWAVRRGAEEMQLHVWAFNRGAIALYERLGWRTTGLKMAKRLSRAG